MHVFMSGPLHLVARELSLIYTFMFVRPPRKRDRQPADDSQFIFVTRQYLNRDFYLTVSNTRARVLRQYVVHQWRNNSLNVRRLLFAYYARTEEERGSIGWFPWRRLYRMLDSIQREYMNRRRVMSIAQRNYNWSLIDEQNVIWPNIERIEKSRESRYR